MSSYEETIEYLLSGRKKFKREVTFNNLFGKYNHQLRFDFGIYNSIGQLECLIEVDGEYHFKPIRGKLAFKKQQAYDEKKNAYCLARNIKLIRIPYWEMEKITYEKIFSTPEFVVKQKNHNNILTPST